ncbi:hypothetical protein CEXT_769311 [Caerostris extrusa]|uniref:Uncharacterized protein n=1 Tax=Caerostris extrusa TaxID=172846 RepID=A0AAV4V1Q0_CAEEX|nr:hypothetical protein CEXT_769311 [Caerostris extrusa]
MKNILRICPISRQKTKKLNKYDQNKKRRSSLKMERFQNRASRKEKRGYIREIFINKPKKIVLEVLYSFGPAIRESSFQGFPRNPWPTESAYPE